VRVFLARLDLLGLAGSLAKVILVLLVPLARQVSADSQARGTLARLARQVHQAFLGTAEQVDFQVRIVELAEKVVHQDLVVLV